MFNGENGYSLSDIAAASGNRNNGGAFGDNSGAWWIIILFLFCFAGGWGNGRSGLFGGSGSTLIACEQLNRNCYMMELDPAYVDVIIDRWEKFTGENAKLIK